MAKTETIQYRPPQDTDELGDPAGPPPDWVDVPGCKLWPRVSTETGREVIIEGHGVKAPPPRGSVPAIDARGTVKARGKEYEVDGVPGLFPGKAQILYLKRVGS